MPTRLLVNGAGTGAGNNLIRSLRVGDPSFVIVGCHHDRFALKKSSADQSYLIPVPSHPGLADALRRIVETERIDLFIPNTDADVELASRLRDDLPCRLFLPAAPVIELCRDKYRLTAFLRSLELPAPLTYPVIDLDEIDEIFRRFARGSQLWCRMRTGAGSMGATPVRSPEQALGWIRYWEEMRGVAPGSFTLSEYLPGRDFACQSLWKEGTLVLIKTCERLSYFGGTGRPSGVSSTAALAKMVYEPPVVEVCARALRGLDAKISGAFSVDLKENENGVPCVTEINAGRFITMMNFFDLTGKHNMTATYVRLALGESVDLREEYDVAEEHYFVRDVDTTPGIFNAEELFEGIEDARK
jgi:carbamoyl-phosphate synthase large subunit